MSHPYNKQYRPPFPALPVHLLTDEAKSGPFEALVDTGADVTFVPSYLLEEIDAQIAFPAAVRSYFGESQPVQLYLVGF